MYILIHMHTCVCVCVSWCLFVVSCRVSRDVARNFSIVVRHWSLDFDCLSLCCALLSVLLRAVAVAFVGFSSLVEYLCLPQLSPLCCLICWLLAVSSVFFLSLFLLLALPLTHATVCRFKTPPCVHSKRPRVCWQHAHMCFNMCAWCRYTRGRLNLQKGGFPSTTHHTHHNNRHKTQDTTAYHHNTTTQPQHTHTPHLPKTVNDVLCVWL